MEEGRSSFNILTGKPTGKGPSEKRRRRQEDNIRTDLKEIGTNTRDCVDSAQDRDYWIEIIEFGIEPPGSISHGVSY